MDTDEFRQRCVERAVKEGISISPIGTAENPKYIVHSNSGKDYLLTKEGNSYLCVERADRQECPSYAHRGYCKHMGRLDAYFLQHGIEDQATQPPSNLTVIVGDEEISARV